MAAVSGNKWGMADLTTQIENASNDPKSATIDGNTVTKHSLKEQIEADQYLKEQAAANKSALPIRFAKLRPGGTV